MAPEKSPRTKTQTLSLRLDPKTRFVLEFLAKLKQQSITTIVENAIKRAGAQGQLNPLHEKSKIWRDFWDVSEGVRQMLLLAEKDFPSDYEDDELRDFIKMHIEFFSETYELSNPDRINVAILWPNIEHYLSMWHETRRNDPWQAGLAMAAALAAAKVEPPEWPREKKEPPEPKKRDFGGGGGSFGKEVDDEIPF